MSSTAERKRPKSSSGANNDTAKTMPATQQRKVAPTTNKALPCAGDDGDNTKESTTLTPVSAPIPASSARNERLQSLFGRDNQPPAPRKIKATLRNGGGGGGGTVRGLVIGAEERTSKGGTPPKMMLTVLDVGHDVTPAYGGIDCAPLGALLLATNRVENPAADKFAPVERVLAGEVDGVDCREVALLQVMFDMLDKDKQPSDASKCRVGTLIEMDRVVANVGNASNGGKAIYVNASPAIKVLGMDVDVLKLLSSSDQLQTMTSLELIASLGGTEAFEKGGGADTRHALAPQRTEYRKLIGTARDKARSELARIGNAVSADEKSNTIAPLLNVVDEVTVEELATGQMRMFGISGFDGPHGVFCQQGITAHEPAPLMARMLVDPTFHDKLPRTFTIAWVMDVKPTAKGGRMDVDMRTITVFDKDGLDKDAPTASALVSTNASVSFCVATNRAAVSIGVGDVDKVTWLYPLVMKVADFAVVAKLPLQTAEVDRVNSFCPGDGPIIDMPGAVRKLGVPVSKAFVVKNLCGNMEQYVGPRKGTQIQFPRNVQEPPSIRRDGWVELTSYPFVFDDLEGEQETRRPGVALQYYVVDREVLDGGKIVQDSTVDDQECTKGEEFYEEEILESIKAKSMKPRQYLIDNTAIYVLSA